MAIIYGNNTIRSTLKVNGVRKLFIAKGYSNKEILDLALKSKIDITYCEKRELDRITNNGIHQGIAGEVKNIETYSLSSLIEASKKVTNPIIVMLDELNDPHNLGAILRSGDAFNISGIVFKSRGQVSLNDTVAKVSTGAINYVKCCQVTNLSQSIVALKKEGFWVVGLDGGVNETLKDVPTNVPLVVVVGSEGYGISRLVKENCDLIVKIPMLGHVNCLNASVACSIALYAIRNR